MSSIPLSPWQQGNLFLATFYSPFLILVSSFALVLVVKHFLLRQTTTPRNPPPSPRRLPIIGNLHQLGLPLHYSLFSLSKKYGPLMMLHLGRVPVVVISSPEAAHEVMKTHDLNFASRYDFKINKKLLYNSKDVVTAPYGDYWRQMKSIFVLQLLSNRRVRSFRVAREERTAKLMEQIERSSLQELNVRELLASLTFDTTCKVAFGRTKAVSGERGEKFNKLLEELTKIVGGFNLGEVFPWLAWLNRVSGKDSQVDRVAKEVDEILEEVIQEHTYGDKEGTSKKFDDEDYVDILLKIQKDEGSGICIDRDGVKALILASN